MIQFRFDRWQDGRTSVGAGSRWASLGASQLTRRGGPYRWRRAGSRPHLLRQLLGVTRCILGYWHPQQHVNELSRQIPELVLVVLSTSQVGCAASLQSAAVRHALVHRQCCVGPGPGQHAHVPVVQDPLCEPHTGPAPAMLPAAPLLPPTPPMPPLPTEQVSGQYLPDAAGTQTPHAAGPQQRWSALQAAPPQVAAPPLPPLAAPLTPDLAPALPALPPLLAPELAPPPPLSTLLAPELAPPFPMLPPLSAALAPPLPTLPPLSPLLAPELGAPAPEARLLVDPPHATAKPKPAIRSTPSRVQSSITQVCHETAGLFRPRRSSALSFLARARFRRRNLRASVLRPREILGRFFRSRRMSFASLPRSCISPKRS